jgi:hypothetical protein
MHLLVDGLVLHLFCGDVVDLKQRAPSGAQSGMLPNPEGRVMRVWQRAEVRTSWR